MLVEVVAVLLSQEEQYIAELQLMVVEQEDLVILVAPLPL
tara:strand:+ start:1340 stop:1459 length:120 start_codon:yes stop_codon:yes gene_type:complete